MKVLMFREWQALPYAARFSTIEEEGVGGTELQLLLHARALRKLGCEVTVVGVSPYTVLEEGVLFLGSTVSKAELLQTLKQEHAETDVVFTNTWEDLAVLKEALPKAKYIQVCQNGPHFEADAHIDMYAFVGTGQISYYATKFKKYRHKFMLLLNVPPLETIYSKIEDEKKRDQIIWVGSMNKQGFRQWAWAMSHVLKAYPTLRWVLCVPSYDLPSMSGRLTPFSGIDLPLDRCEWKNLTLFDLAQEIQRSQILLASLGGEDGPVSYLDGHALGVPVLCADDIIGKFSNPEGTGIRCTTVAECVKAVEFLLINPQAGVLMGAAGKKWLQSNLTEQHQQQCLELILSYVKLQQEYRLPQKCSVQSDKKFPFRYWLERAAIKCSKNFNAARTQHALTNIPVQQ